VVGDLVENESLGVARAKHRVSAFAHEMHQTSGAPRVGTSPQWGGLNLVDLELNPVVCVDVDPEEVAATYLG
jgi:hypothetical protein